MFKYFTQVILTSLLTFISLVIYVETTHTSTTRTVDVPITCYNELQRIIYDTVVVYDTVKIEALKSNPRALQGYTKMSVKQTDYIAKFLPYAQEAEDSFGVDKYFILAQCAYEGA